MKIINSHYIPLPEPRWLIVDPKGAIYEQLGTLTVVEEAPKEKGKYGIITHSHPVVAFADIGYTEDDGDRINIMTSLTIADGRCWMMWFLKIVPDYVRQVIVNSYPITSTHWSLSL